MTQARKVPRVLILGGGYVGLYAALALREQLGRREAAVVVVDPRSYMTYQPFLPEAAAGNLEPRHVVVPLRRTLPGCTILSGRVTSVDHAQRRAKITPLEGEAYEVSYDYLVTSLGAIARTLPIPGLAEVGLGFKQIEEAIALRNAVLGKMEVASSTWDPQLRRRLLTFTFVGGGFAGIEALAEVEDMARNACRDFDSIRREDLRFVLIEAAGRILPELGEELGGYALEQLRARGIDLKLDTRLESCVDGEILTSDGDRFASDTVVWTAGVKANPALGMTDLPTDDRGRVTTNAALQVLDADGNVVDGAWAAGDCAAVPDLTAQGGATCAPTAQHAVRQGRHLGQNLARQIQGEPLVDYEHASVGTVASLGLYKGVAQVFGIKLRGPIAWFMHRTYHMWAMPTLNRKVRIVLDWTTALLFRREMVALGSFSSPRAEFQAAAGDGAAPAGRR
ncbi:MAG: NAD(P)/FAD-dependent oxidoreductase [Beutenbergiaceae bacterium]